MLSLSIADYRHIVVLTGQGLCAPLGERPPAGDRAESTPQVPADQDELQARWAAFSRLRRRTLAVEPGAAHLALAAAQARLMGDQRLKVLTLCRDGLHARAGSQAVIELYGSYLHSRCRTLDCALPWFFDPHDHSQRLPYCPLCGGPLYPGVVGPDEPIPADRLLQARRELRRCDLFLAVGLLEWGQPAEGFLRLAQEASARTVWVGLLPPMIEEPGFDQLVSGLPARLLPELLGRDSGESHP